MNKIPQEIYDKIQGFNELTQRWLIDANFRFYPVKDWIETNPHLYKVKDWKKYFIADLECLKERGEVVLIADVLGKEGDTVIERRRYYFANGTSRVIVAARANLKSLPKEPLATEKLYEFPADKLRSRELCLLAKRLGAELNNSVAKAS